MPHKKQRLELTWIGKENRPKLEPRILVEDPERSHLAPHRVGATDLFDNKLIFGDNLLALKSLEHDYSGKVKCVFIDPPYNTGSAFEHYDDGVEHSLWLSLMRDRLELIRGLLSRDGSLWVTIDDNEVHYLKVLCDEVFGRKNFVIQNTVKRSAPTGHKAINPTPVQVADYVLVYAKDRSIWKYRPQFTERGFDKAYNKFIEDYESGPSGWKIVSLKSALRKLGISLDACVQRYPERIIRFAQPNFQGVGKETKEWIIESRSRPSEIFIQHRREHADIYLLKGDRILFYKDKLKEVDGKLTTGELLTNMWLDIPYQGIAREGDVVFPKGKKPEKLIKRVLEIATDAGDLVLDSFLGSGTSAAVAHKMRRRWIGIELGEHCHTHCIPRLKRVIDGEDPGGITKAVDWKGGGGFCYYKLAPSLLEKDKWDNWVISKDYNAAMLAEAVCKLEGFTYAPSDRLYWQHGQSTEQDFIYVTTASLKHAQLQQLSEEVGPERSLLVVCTSFRGSKEGYPNLTVKKIPKAVLNRCEWGKDDYSLRVENLPAAPEALDQQNLFTEEEDGK